MFVLLASVALLSADTVPYANAESWLCRPGRHDECAIDLTTTLLQGDGTRTIEKWSPAKNPPIDCFYVYPTVSRDTSEHSDLLANDAERNVVHQQFARFASTCRPFAPMYRQVTIRGLQKMMASPGVQGSLSSGMGYDDVAAAWAYYLAHDNKGRGVVLIGHSQGAMILTELIRREIDGKPAQKLVVSALLMGTSIAVPKGKDVGGTFQSMPLCRRVTQVGCLISFASFRSTLAPSATSLFGRVPGDGMESACVNPAALAGGSAPLHAYFVSAGTLITGAPSTHRWVDSPTPLVTPYVSVPGLLTAECVSDARGSRLDVTVHADAADPRADDIPGDLGAGTPAQAQWGLHLVDVNLVMGNLLDIVARQSAAFRAKR